MSKKQIELVIGTATAEIGYKEKGTNITKYADDFDKKYPDFYNYKKQGVAWCDIFVDWVFVTSFGEEKALKMLCQPKKSAGAGCKYSAEYYAKKNRFFSAPQAGDQIFFISNGEINHTGIVTKVDDKKVYTIEGNSSNTVKAHSYALSNKNIAGYGRPVWDEETIAETAPTKSEPAKGDTYYTVVKGDTLTAIAKKYKTTVADLQAINKIANPDHIVIGQKILLPKTSVSVSVEPPKPETPQTFIGIVNTVRLPLNVRAGAGTIHAVVKTLPKGSKVELFTELHNGWYQLADKSGYVSSQYIIRGA